MYQKDDEVSVLYEGRWVDGIVVYPWKRHNIGACDVMIPGVGCRFFEPYEIKSREESGG